MQPQISGLVMSNEDGWLTKDERRFRRTLPMFEKELDGLLASTLMEELFCEEFIHIVVGASGKKNFTGRPII
jgi:hypothetical protein